MPSEYHQYRRRFSSIDLCNKAVDNYQKADYWQRQARKYLEQFLVNQLSRRGLIPTYSFPVHSLTLEVIREQGGHQFGFGGSEIELNRDASLGIAEYAPGSEVVANGRIWTSEGLAFYPKQFMPDRWYVACVECFHVDIDDTAEEIPAACSNCGLSAGRRKRKFIEPRGFVTGYARRKGRDPGSSRRRVKPAEEARLISSARDEQFEACGTLRLKTALLRAHSKSESMPQGTMFIANKGVYGEGYLRCDACNFTEAKQPAGTARSSHKDPLTGSNCPKLVETKAIDLVHCFDTDVRLYRFLEPLPAKPNDELSQRGYSERVARTIAEASRFAAAELLGVQSNAIRATYRLFGSGIGLLEVVLYDAVPGGAGYCAKLGSPPCGHQLLLEQVRRRLDCPAACSNGCRQCLCDYSNQPYWDGFERTAALEWVRGIVEQETKMSEPGSFQRWNSPSVAALEDRLANFEEIYILARRVADDEITDQAALKLLIRWLQAEKRVTLLLTEEPGQRPRSVASLEAYRFLHPFALRGDLNIACISKSHRDNWILLPRIFPKPTLGAPLFRQAFAHQAVLSDLMLNNVEIGTCDEHLRKSLEGLISNATRQPIDFLKEGNRLKWSEFKEGESRVISEVFEAIAGSHVKRKTIRDPYCGAKRQRGKLHRFLAELLKVPLAFETVEIFCREVKQGTDYEHHRIVKQHIQAMLKLGVVKHS